MPFLALSALRQAKIPRKNRKLFINFYPFVNEYITKGVERGVKNTVKVNFRRF